MNSLQSLFLAQCAAAQLEILHGPGKIARWRVPANARHPQTGKLVHDDYLISAALCTQLDGLTWGAATSTIIASKTPWTT